VDRLLIRIPILYSLMVGVPALLWMAVLTAALVVSGSSMIPGRAGVDALLCALLCIGAMLAALVASTHLGYLRTGGRVLVVDERGVDIVALGLGPIPWSEIRGVRGIGVFPLRLQWLVVRDLHAALANARPWARLRCTIAARFRLGPLWLPTGGVISPERLAALIEARMKTPAATKHGAGSLE
jgi:hypothetical protein